MCLSDRAKNEQIVLIDKIELEKPKTKQAFEILQNLKLREKKTAAAKDAKDAKAQKDNKKKVKNSKEKSVLLVLPKKLDNIKRSFRNIPRVEIINANSLNVVDVLKSQILLMPVNSIQVIKDVYGE